MANFDTLKKRAAEAAGTLADKSLVFARKAADKTKSVAKITKLSTDVAGEREKIRRNYVKIGKKYYELYKDAPSEELQSFVDEISVSLSIIEAKKAEIEELKTADDVSDADIEVEIEVEPEEAEDAEEKEAAENVADEEEKDEE